MENNYTPSADLSELYLHISKMGIWLKTLGIFFIFCGVISIFFLVGIIPLWIGILLFQAGERSQKTLVLEDVGYATQTLKKIRRVFVISVFFILFSIALGLTTVYYFSDFIQAASSTALYFF